MPGSIQLSAPGLPSSTISSNAFGYPPTNKPRPESLDRQTHQPPPRRSVAHIADSLQKRFPYDDIDHLSRVDQENLSSLLLNNIEWVTPETKRNTLSKRPWFNTFYVNKANFYEGREDKDFFLAIDPAIQQIQAKETGNSQSASSLNSKRHYPKGHDRPEIRV